MEFRENNQSIEIDRIWNRYTNQRPSELTTWSGSPTKYCYVEVTTLSGLDSIESNNYTIVSDYTSYGLQYVSSVGKKYSFVGYDI